MKIVQVVHDFPPNNVAGTEIHTLNLSKELIKKHEVWVFCREFGHFNKEFQVVDEVYDGLNVRRVFYNGKENILSSLKNEQIEMAFEDLLDIVKPDIIHIQHLLWLSVSFIKIAKQRGLPVLLTLHDYWHICPLVNLIKSTGDICSGPDSGEKCFDCQDSFANMIPTREFVERKDGTRTDHLIVKAKNVVPNFLWRSIRTSLTKVRNPSRGEFIDEESLAHRKECCIDLLNNADMVISPSDFVKEKYVEYDMRKEKITVIEEGMNLEWLTNLKRQPYDILRFGYIGTIFRVKGIHILIDAFNRLKGENAELLVYGRGDSTYLNELKEMCGNERVQFLGYFDTLSEPFSKIDVLIVPSVWHETFSVVIREAFAAGIPVIASDVGAIPEVVKDGINGLLFKKGDTEHLDKQIKRLIENPQLIEEFRRNIPEIKDMKSYAKEIDLIYKTLMRKNDAR